MIADRATRLTAVNAAGSAALSALLLTLYFLFGSLLALAQAADSIADVFSSSVLAWAARHSERPADEAHPLGHASAQPIAALVVAVLTGVLSIEVFRSSISALATGAQAELDIALVFVFTAKVVFKAGLIAVAQGSPRRPVLDALIVDARNDCAVGLAAILGYVLAELSWPAVDPLLALGVALYIGWSGLGLARENVTLLMGAAAPPERREHLERVVRQVAGVDDVAGLVVTWHGNELHVQAEIRVAKHLPIVDAHAIAHEVEECMRRENEVGRVIVHVEPSP